MEDEGTRGELDRNRDPALGGKGKEQKLRENAKSGRSFRARCSLIWCRTRTDDGRPSSRARRPRVRSLFSRRSIPSDAVPSSRE